MNAYEALTTFANTCGIPNVGGVKHGWGKLALAHTPMLKFESKHYNAVREALGNTLEKDKSISVFFKGVSLVDSIKGNPPKGKYFTVCVEPHDDKHVAHMAIAHFNSIGI